MDVCLICDGAVKEAAVLACGHRFCFHCIMPYLRWFVVSSVFTCPQCQDPLLSMEIGERTLGFAELRLAVLTYAYMYWSPCQAGALAKEVILEGLEEQMKTERPLTQGACALMDDGEFDWLWLEMGLSR